MPTNAPILPNLIGPAVAGPNVNLTGTLFSVGPSRFTTDYQRGVYLANRMRTVYLNSSGMAALPVAGPDGTPAKIVKTAAAHGGKIVSFVVARLGLMPLVPGPEKSDPNVVYLNGEVWIDAPAVQIDGNQYVYSAMGWYAYAFKLPVWTDKGLPMGSLVTDATTPKNNVLPAAAFVDPQKDFGGRATAPGNKPNLLATLTAAAAPNP